MTIERANQMATARAVKPGSNVANGSVIPKAWNAACPAQKASANTALIDMSPARTAEKAAIDFTAQSIGATR